MTDGTWYAHANENDENAPKSDIQRMDDAKFEARDKTEAFWNTRAIVDARVTDLFARRPDRYQAFAFTTEGHCLIDADGRSIRPEDMDPLERAAHDLAEHHAGLFGPHTDRILASEVEPAPQTAWWCAGHANEMEVYVIGLNDDPRAGEPEDLRVRPVADGVGEYTMTVAPYDLTSEEGAPFVFYQPDPRSGRTMPGPSFV